jgi:hypothetical protein
MDYNPIFARMFLIHKKKYCKMAFEMPNCAKFPSDTKGLEAFLEDYPTAKETLYQLNK